MDPWWLWMISWLRHLDDKAKHSFVSGRTEIEIDASPGLHSQVWLAGCRLLSFQVSRHCTAMWPARTSNFVLSINRQIIVRKDKGGILQKLNACIKCCHSRCLGTLQCDHLAHQAICPKIDNFGQFQWIWQVDRLSCAVVLLNAPQSEIAVVCKKRSSEHHIFSNEDLLGKVASKRTWSGHLSKNPNGQKLRASGTVSHFLVTCVRFYVQKSLDRNTPRCNRNFMQGSVKKQKSSRTRNI